MVTVCKLQPLALQDESPDTVARFGDRFYGVNERHRGSGMSNLVGGGLGFVHRISQEVMRLAWKWDGLCALNRFKRTFV